MKDRRGAALMLVLWILVALAAVSSAVLAATRSSSGLAANDRARVVARYAAESGVTLAVATLEGGLAAAAEPGVRRDYLNHLDRTLGDQGRAELGDGRLAVTLVDVGSRLDVNAADGAALTRLFSFFTTPNEAERAAAAVRAFVGGGSEPDGSDAAAAADGREVATGAAGAAMARTLGVLRPLRSVDELYRVPGVPRDLVRRASVYLTVDGDGSTNRSTASDTVLAAAAGDLRDEPSRILVISRGWQDGRAMTHQIEAVYAVAHDELTLVRWRERDL